MYGRTLIVYPFRSSVANSQSQTYTAVARRVVLTASLVCASIALQASSGSAQDAASKGTAAGSTSAAQSGETASSSSGQAEQQSWTVRDPLTGRLFQQVLVTRTVPTTQWEVRPVATTVYEPRQVVTTVPTQQVTYTPATQYVMQPRLKGWWNPLKQPVQSYEFVPVTTWQPQTQTVQQPVTTTQWVAKQQMVYVPQAVQRNQTQQQIVSREIPQPSGGYPPGGNGPGSYPGYTSPPNTLMAAQQNSLMSRPLVSIPWLGRQPTALWNNASSHANANSLAALSGAGSSGFSNPGFSSAGFSGGLRPIAPTYSTPLPTASSASAQLARDPTQTGMSATVLR